MLVGVGLGVGIAVLVHRSWSKWAPLSLLGRMARRNPQRLPSKVTNSDIKRPEPTTEYAISLLGPDCRDEQYETTRYLITDLDRHHRKILDHGYRVAAVAETLAIEAGWDNAAVRQLVAAAIFHDAGWMGISPRTIDSPGPYSTEAAEQLVRHTTYGRLVLGQLADVIGASNNAITHHHEHWDGSGYPNGLSRQAIAKEARLLAVADAYVSLTSPDLGGSGLSSSEAVAAIAKSSGTKFEPASVRALLLSCVRRTPASVVGGATGVSLFRMLSSSWASTSTGVAVAAVTVAGLNLAAPDVTKIVTPTPDTTVVVTRDSVVETTTTTTAKKATTTTAKKATTTSTTAAAKTPSTTTSTTQLPTTVTVPEQLGLTTEPTTTTAQPTTQPPVAPTAPPTTVTNRLPNAGGDSASTRTGESVSIPVLSNDSDADGSIRSSSLAIETGPQLGTATVSGSAVVYTAGQTPGTDRFSYRICDDRGGCSTAIVAVTISQSLEAVNDSMSVPSGSPLAIRIGVLGNDKGDLDYSTLSVSSPPSSGSASVSGSSISYTTATPLAPGAVIVIGYRVCDRSGGCDDATATVTAG